MPWWSLVVGGAVALGALRWAWARADERDEQAKRDAAARERDVARRALDDLEPTTRIPDVLLAPPPRALSTTISLPADTQARVTRLLQTGFAVKGVILAVRNGTDAEGLLPDVYRFAYRTRDGVIEVREASGEAWSPGRRPEWCRVRRPVIVVVGADDDAIVVEHFRPAPAGPDAEPASASERAAVLPFPSSLARVDARGGAEGPLLAGAYRLRTSRHAKAFLIAPGDDVVLGRDPTCDIALVSDQLARRHLRLHHDGHALHYRDLGTASGTFKNGRHEDEGVLAPGDRLSVGDLELTVELVAPDPLPC